MLGGIAAYVFAIVLFRKKLNHNIYPWAILMLNISLLLMGFLRSCYVYGVDINIEYHIFQLVKANQQWNMSLFRNFYNTCLSVSLLPTILSSFLKINDQYIFKLIILLLFSITPIRVYLFLKRYTQSIFAFMASFFFLHCPCLFYLMKILVPYSRKIFLHFWFFNCGDTLFNCLHGCFPLYFYLFDMLGFWKD